MYHLVIGLLRAERALPYVCHYGVLAYAQQDGGFPYGDTPRATPSTTPFGHNTLPLFAALFVYSLAIRLLRGRRCVKLGCVAVKACYTVDQRQRRHPDRLFGPHL
jgi:hypothetical protein